MKKVLIWGANGWLASEHFIPILNGNGWDVIQAPNHVRAEDSSAVGKLLDEVCPSHVVAFIGRTHGPGFNSIDYLEQPGKLSENIRDNLTGPLTLALACIARSIHYTYMGTGCIFSNDTTDPEHKIYHESDNPDFFGSSYSIVKGCTDRMMRQLQSCVLNVRIRMPISREPHQRDFITKIVSYPKICSMPNSMTVLPTLFPYLEDMMSKNHIGTVNLVNPGVISHDEILEMYRELIDPELTWENMSAADQRALLKSDRSNNELDTSALQSMYPNVLNIREAVRQVLMYRANQN